MPVAVIIPPQPVVSWDEANWHLRLDGDTEQQAYVEGLIAVATAWLDGPDGWLGRALGEQTLEAVYPVTLASGARRYPLPPFLALVSEVAQSDGCTTKVRWRAGYAPSDDGKSTVPAPIRHAILLMVSHLFNNRDAVTTTQAQPVTLPLGVDALLSPYRVWSV